MDLRAKKEGKMRKRGVSPWLFVLLLLVLSCISFCRICSGEWVHINPNVFADKGSAAGTFQEALFDCNNLFVVTSDSTGMERQDPNRETILWTSVFPADPNAWVGDLWKEMVVNGGGVRVDKLFGDGSYRYAGVYADSNCQLWRIEDPNRIQNIAIGSSLSQLRIEAGALFGNKIYIGIYEEGDGVKVLRGNAPQGPVTEEVSISGLQAGDPNIHISLMTHAGDGLFIGTRATGSGAALVYTENGIYWFPSDQDAFDDPNISKDIVGYLSMVIYRGDAWLLTEYVREGKRGWACWKKNKTSSIEEPLWEIQLSSRDSLGPFADPNILGVSSMHPLGEYLYIGYMSGNGGGIWKVYGGEEREWLPVPPPADPGMRFDPNNLFRDIFSNSMDIDHIYAGTMNEEGARILLRLAPRMDLSSLSWVDRFIGPRKKRISMCIIPNWDDPAHFTDPNKKPESTFFSYGDPNREQISIEPILPDPNGNSIWEFDPNILTGEGQYALRLEMEYGEEQERVVRYLSFAWDTNAPTVPEITNVGIGDSRIRVEWSPSSDSLEDAGGLEDANFSQSIMQYELRYWQEDNPGQDTNMMIPVAYISGNPQPRSADVSGLENWATYKFCVRAWDKANNVSSWSADAEGTPKPTMGWMELVGEEGKCFIGALDAGSTKKRRDGRGWFAGLRAGRFKIRSEQADMVYGEDRAWPVHVEVGWIHRRYLDISLRVGYVELDGTAVLPDTYTRSIDELTFRMVPGSMTFRLIPFGHNGHLLIPYVGGGLDAWWYQEEKQGRDDVEGWNYGYHAVYGIRLLLDRFDPKHASHLEADYGVIDTYLVIEAVHNWIDDFGESRLDLGGIIYQIGIIFLF